MAQSTPTDGAAFVTFYSFKGGVGRSMALVNVAGIMAGRGFRVLALDMDLEAPGISYLMRHEANMAGQELPGFVDLLSDACTRGEGADLFALSPQEVVEKYSYRYTIPEEIRQSGEGLLRIMPAGRFDGHYQERLDSLGLGQLYRDGHGRPLIAAFKDVIASSRLFDFVFIDSRTGFSDESGICTRDLGDYLVVVMGLNRQNQEGTEEFLRSLRVSGSTPKGLQVILSPVPNGEDELVEKREKEVAAALSQAWEGPLKLSLQIPYHPRLALTEEPHIFRRTRGYLFEAYAEIERAVLGMLNITAVELRKEIRKAAVEKRLDLVLTQLEKLAKLNRSYIADSLMIVSELRDLFLRPDAGEIRRFAAVTLTADSWAVVHLATALAKNGMDDAGMFYDRGLEANPNDAAMLGDYASFLFKVRNDYNGAEVFYERALKVDPNHVLVLGNYAIFLFRVRKNYEVAERFFKRALEVDPNNAANLGNYGNFLADVRKDYNAAELFYQRSLEIEPYSDHTLANYAKLLFTTNRPHKAESVMAKAWEQGPQNSELEVELLFYSCAHGWQNHPEALRLLKALLESGASSPDWPLEENVRVARESGHPHLDFIAALAKVVSGKAKVTTLEAFDVWKRGSF